MLRGKLLLGAAALAAALATGGVSTGPAEAADISCRTAKLIVPWGAGGGTDVIFRVFVEAVNKQGAEPQLQVVNIGGQGGNKGAKEAVKAKADGCTLFAIHQSAITSYLNGRVDFTWDAFEPVAMLTRTPAIFGANPDVPYSNIKELVEEAKKKPGEIVAGGTLGSTSHFVFLLLEDAAGIKFKHVSYDGTRQRMTALLAKNIELGEINLASAKKYITTGELKALGITTPDRNSEIGDVMTLKEQGYDMVYGTDRGIMLPKDTPQEIIDHYGALFQKAATDPEVVAQMNAKGTEVVYYGPAEYTAYFEETFTNWKRIAKEVGLYKGE
ncbi:tripartite tricarboxylate transporter substrate binding protein [Pelagibius litoralis]|uniref:Tripartite tricarboxylate transporter substrate binding protein n=1 Tax=Pelagibius litoralis TaxID=374515 RepID=A0A967C224_9PROT|nr:tripartite tricarboxylate transporter substrate binding protein [Pelagibius litoralis]NIA68551.1 tripartite tricarboxylate transporter substrate binding protein [Pelagibius litoralis]